MAVLFGLLSSVLLIAGSWQITGRVLRQGHELGRILATAVLAWAWLTIGLQALGSLGLLAGPPLLVWNALAFVTGLVVGGAPPSLPKPSHGHDSGQLIAGPPHPVPWRWESAVVLGLLIWAGLILGGPSLLLPVKVVSDGPIYHLYFAVRWWKVGRLELIAAPFGENAATYFPANGDLWFSWLLICWGGDRLARVGQVPFLVLAGLTAYAIARRLGTGRDAALLGTSWFLTSMAFLIFSFEANVDTIFVAGYLLSTYFLLRHAIDHQSRGSLGLGGLAAGLALGTKSVALVFLPPLFLYAIFSIRARQKAWQEEVSASVTHRNWHEFSGQVLLFMAAILATSGFWFARNMLLTGNPIYPLQVKIAGTPVLSGWYAKSAMENSRYYIDSDDWRALIDILMAQLDPRLAPLWMAAAIGGWVCGKHRGRSECVGMRFMTGLALANIALYWILIPYRTQQRFMLQALGLCVAPLSRLFDRGRWLTLLGTGLLTVHLLTPQYWPFVAGDGPVREFAIPWDLSPIIPNAVAPLVPVVAQIHRGARGLVSAVILLTSGVLSVYVAWIAMRNRHDRSRIVRIGLTCALLVIAMFVENRPDRGNPRELHFPPFQDFYRGWMALDSQSGLGGTRIAYAGTNIPYYLFGAGLRNDVQYVNVDEHAEWLMHDYHRAAAERSSANSTWPNPRPGWDRAHPDFHAWVKNLKAERIKLLVVTRVDPDEGPHNVADTEAWSWGQVHFPIEKVWADSHPDLFEPLYGTRGSDPFFRIYLFQPAKVPRSISRSISRIPQ